MKNPSVLRRVLLPAWLLMLFLPILICGAFQITGKHYAVSQTRQQLRVLCERLDRYLRDADPSGDLLGQTFQEKVGGSVNRSKLVDGVLILNEDGGLVYPDDPAEAAGSAALAAAFHDAILRGEDRVCLAVENDGPAIDPELLPHIFERFYKGSDGNFGLGLPIAQNAARFMGGSLTVENIPGTGVRFTLRLPAAGGESA